MGEGVSSEPGGASMTITEPLGAVSTKWADSFWRVGSVKTI